MTIQKQKAIAQSNVLRFNKESSKGHYESYFLRANHPTKKEAFWIRYTIFSPKGNKEKAIGEVWAIYFNEKGHVASKKEVNIDKCELNNTHFSIQIENNSLGRTETKGDIDNFSWDLQYDCEEAPLFLLPLNYYDLPFPKAKSIVSQPFAKFSGKLKVGDKVIEIKDWIGSQNHNWGEKHTDYYAWGQVAGFDNYPDTFLEIITAKQKVGIVSTPFLTLLVLKHKGKIHQLNTIVNGFKSKGKFDFFEWEFSSENKDVKISGKITADKSDFVGLNYYNPSGGTKDCLNSKVASCELIIEEKSKVGYHHELVSKQSTAFEILTDRVKHGVEINF